MPRAERRSAFLPDSAKEPRVRTCLLVGDLRLQKLKQVRCVVVIQIVHVPRILLRTDICLKVVVVLEQITLGIEVLLIDERLNFLLAQLIQVNLYSVLLKADAAEIIFDQSSNQLLLYHEILSKIPESKSDLHTPLIVITDKVEDCHELLAFVRAEAAAELLDEDRLGVRGSEEQDHVDPGDVDTFVEDVNGEQNLQFTPLILQILICSHTFSCRIASRQITRVIVILHRLRHPNSMGHILAECQCFQLRPSNPMFFNHLMDEFTVLLVGELLDKLMAFRRLESIFDQFITNAIVVEWHDQAINNCIPESQLVRYISIKESEDIISIHTLRCGCYAEQELWLEVVDNLLVGCCRRMMALIDNDVIESVFVKQFQRVCHRHIGGKDEICVKLLKLRVIYSKGPLITKHTLEGLIGLKDNRSLMNDV